MHSFELVFCGAMNAHPEAISRFAGMKSVVA
jgi:hypothetical protein